LKNKSSISKAQSYREIGEFWDRHDLSNYWERTQPVEFEIDIQQSIGRYKEMVESNSFDKFRP
jgi:hypothetical protein